MLVVRENATNVPTRMYAGRFCVGNRPCLVKIIELRTQIIIKIICTIYIIAYVRIQYEKMFNASIEKKISRFGPMQKLSRDL